MEWIYDDGGRSKYFRATDVSDCVCRAISIAAKKDYKEVYDLINKVAKSHRRSDSSARNGVSPKITREVMEILGWQWVPTMTIGSGCTVHLRSEELPNGRIIAKVSHHVVAVIDGVIHDIYDPSRDGDRCVYGYYYKKGCRYGKVQV